MMELTISGRHFICRLPVGGGKSACWLLTAIAAESTGLLVGSSFVVSPYSFLAEHHAKSARKHNIECVLLESGDIQRGRVPAVFANGVPSIVFLTIDTFSKLMAECQDFLRLSIQRCLIRRIIIDEAHLPFLEIHFRLSYESLRSIIGTLLGIQLIALSGTLPYELAQILSIWYGMHNAIVQDCTNLGLGGIPIQVKAWDGNCATVQQYVHNNLPKGHIHIFCKTKSMCKNFRDYLRKSVDVDVEVHMVTGDSTEEERKAVFMAIDHSRCHILLTTTCALVGFENKMVRFVLVLGFIYNIPSVVQAAGRLRPSQRANGCDFTILCRQTDFNGSDDSMMLDALTYAGLSNETVRQFVASQALVDFLVASTCRLQFLAKEFGFGTTPQCGICDNCKGASINNCTDGLEHLSQASLNLSQSSIGTFASPPGMPKQQIESFQPGYDIFSRPATTTASPLVVGSPFEGSCTSFFKLL